jgi:hypothetical protein
VQLDGAVEARSVERRLHVPRNRESIFEADCGALIDPEQARGLVAKAAAAQVAGKPVRDAEVALEQRQPQSGRQVDDDEVGLCRNERAVILRRRCRVSRAGIWMRRGVGRRLCRGDVGDGDRGHRARADNRAASVQQNCNRFPATSVVDTCDHLHRPLLSQLRFEHDSMMGIQSAIALFQTAACRWSGRTQMRSGSATSADRSGRQPFGHQSAVRRRRPAAPSEPGSAVSGNTSGDEAACPFDSVICESNPICQQRGTRPVVRGLYA